MTAAAPTLAVGDVVATRTYPIERDTLVRYAGASGDFNPIHYRDDVAQSVGLPGVLAHGMLTMGLAVQPVLEWLDGRGEVLEYGVRFTRPVPVPAQGSVELKVSAAVGVLAGDGTARIDITARVGGQAVLGRAQVLVRLPEAASSGAGLPQAGPSGGTG
ncbi:MaoC/PaaZ C-terminal domain-containing protein [uncultured Amnibacterium sp.]|uniref:MaoC/PaaZ C-terminal domain-containing protein n=1 Tax=uncultured Amnibacterium sp. TaxID=1631851 RepID=UPI0035C9EA80